VISVQVQVSADVQRIFNQLRAVDLDEAVELTAEDAEAFAKRGFRDTARTGRRYKRGKRGKRGKRRYHIASAEGNFPAVDSGELTRNTRTEPLGKARYRIVFGKTYSIYLEFGTRRMSARPFAQATMEYAEKRLSERADAALRRASR
jgi:hypothetical protein